MALILKVEDLSFYNESNEYAREQLTATIHPKYQE